MAEIQTTPEMKDLLTMYRNLFVDLPLTWVEQRLGLTEEKETMEIGWKGYDTGVRLANSGIESLYRNPLFGKVMGRSLEMLLRWQQVNKTVAGAFFTTVWRSVGLPTADETEALRAQVQALREELRAQSNNLTVRPKEPHTVTQRGEVLSHAARATALVNGASKALRTAA